jgi:DNA-binding response OmpR family regulator
MARQADAAAAPLHHQQFQVAHPAGQHADLLITDVGLPGGMNGRQLAEAARQRRPGLKVLFITGYAEDAPTRNGMLEPAMDVLTKPFSLDVFAQRVTAMLKLAD